MACPQPIYSIRISKELWKKLIQVDLSGIEWRVIGCWFECGYGKGKRNVEFNITFVCEKINCSHRQQVHRAVWSLIDRGIFEVVGKIKATRPLVIRFIKDYDKWKDKEGRLMFGMTKGERDKKEILKREGMSEDEQMLLSEGGRAKSDPLLNYFIRGYEKIYKCKYMINWGRNKKTQKTLLKRFDNDLEYCKKIVDELFDMNLDINDFSFLDAGWVLNKIVKMIKIKEDRIKDMKLEELSRKERDKEREKEWDKMSKDPEVQRKHKEFMEIYEREKERRKK